MAFLAVGGLTRRNAEKHIGLLLYGAVRSELQLSVSLSSVRHHLLEPLVRGNAHNVSVHASIDCSLPCTVASVRSAMTDYRLEPELLHVEEGTNSTDNMERYTRAMQHAVRASASALREDAKMAICARIDLEYASVLRPELVTPGCHRTLASCIATIIASGVIAAECARLAVMDHRPRWFPHDAAERPLLLRANGDDYGLPPVTPAPA